MGTDERDRDIVGQTDQIWKAAVMALKSNTGVTQSCPGLGAVIES